ncbi:acetate--CoA ligase family protein [Yinghuangia aomiensis]
MAPDDAQRLVDFYARVSDESKYLRFFTPYPRLSERDVRHFTHHDWVDRVGLGLFSGGNMVAIVRYDRIGPDGRAVRTGPGGRSSTAEVAFLVQDDQQGRGVASVLPGAHRRRRPRTRHPQVRRRRAAVQPAHDQGLHRSRLHPAVAPSKTASSASPSTSGPPTPPRPSMLAREHRAEAGSTGRLLNPRSVAVVGAGRHEGTVGNTLLRNLAASGFTGPVYAVNPSASGEPIEGFPSYASVRDIPDSVDLAVVAVPAAAVQDGRRRMRPQERPRTGRRLLRIRRDRARRPGSAAPPRHHRAQPRHARHRTELPSASSTPTPPSAAQRQLAPRMPRRGRVGMFAQSGALGIAILESTVNRGIGLSTFVSAGNRADVSGNDLLQYWEDDPATDVVLLHLESLGNPRKFTRLARRVARTKPVVAVKSLHHAQRIPLGHATRALTLDDKAVDSLFRQAGVIRVPTVAEMFDVAQLLAYQPLPAGGRVAIVGNSDSLGLLAQDAATSAGLDPLRPVDLTTSATPTTSAKPSATASTPTTSTRWSPSSSRPSPPTATTSPASSRTWPNAPSPSANPSSRPTSPTRACPTNSAASTPTASPPGAPSPPTRHPRTPSAPSPKSSATQPGAAAPPANTWTSTTSRPTPRAPSSARSLFGAADAAGLSPSEAAELLGCYGIHPSPAIRVDSEDAAIAAAEQLGYPVVLKTIAEHLRHRVDLDGVRLDLGTEVGLRRAFRRMSARLGGPDQARLVVQRMAPRGVATTVGLTYDESFGTLLHFGLAGTGVRNCSATSRTGWSPATDQDVADLVRDIRAAPVLFGYRGAPPVDVAALEELLLRLSQLADDLPHITSVQLDPVVVTEGGLTVLDARVRLSRPPARTDLGPRAMRNPY